MRFATGERDYGDVIELFSDNQRDGPSRSRMVIDIPKRPTAAEQLKLASDLELLAVWIRREHRHDQ